MDKSASAIVEQQKQTATSQKPKKKPRNNKKASGNSFSTNSSNGISSEVAVEAIREEVAGDTMSAANGLSEKFKQHLHIAGDGLQLNGTAGAHAASAAAKKCNSQIDSHVAQNGHYSPTNEKTSNMCTNATMAQPKQQLSMQQETTAVGAIKKSKSKSNKQKNKEANIVCNKDNVLSHQLNDHRNDKPPPATEAIHNSSTDDAVMVQKKNGFHDCISERADNGLPCKGAQQQQKCASIENIKQNINLIPAQQTINSKSQLLTTSTVTPTVEEVKGRQTITDVRVAGAEANVSTNVSIKSATEPQTNIWPQDHNDTTTTTTTNSNPTTAKIQNTNNNTAKQNDDDIDENAQQTVANTKANTTKPEAVEGDESQLSKAAATANLTTTAPLDLSNVHIEYKEYESELQMHDIMRLIQAELSEPYSIYTYRYFIYNWPKLCFLAAHGNEYVGAIVCKLDMHMNLRRGYIAMLAVRKEYRKLKIGTTLVQKAIEAMLADNADEVVLETEMRNVPALRLYENLGFVRDKRLFRYYLNGVDALRLKLWFR